MPTPGTRDLDFKAVVDELSDGVIVADASMTVLFANGAAAKLLGRSAAELVGIPVAELVPARMRERHLAGVRRYLQTGTGALIGGPPAQVALGPDAGGLELELSLSAVGIPGDEDFLVVAVLRDVGARIAFEQDNAGRYLRAMLTVIAELEKAPGEEAAMTRILPALCRGLGWERASLWSFVAAEGELVCLDTWRASLAPGEEDEDDVDPIAPGSRLRRGEALVGACAEAMQTVGYSSASGSSPALGESIETLVAFPLLAAGDELLGVVELRSRLSTVSARSVAELLDAIGRQIGQFVLRVRAEERRRQSEQENAELLARTLQAERSQAFLLQASRIVSEARGSAEALDALSALAVPVLGDICLIDTIDESGQVRRVAARHANPDRQAEVDQLGLHYPPSPLGSHPSVRVMHTGRSLWSGAMSEEFLRATTRDESHYQLVRSLGFSSYLTVPLKSRRRVIGTITVVSTDPGRPLGSREVILAESLASQAAEAVDKARHYEREHEMAHVLQTSLLPGDLDQVAGFDIAVRYLPSTLWAEVGGDWYDVVTLEDGLKAVVIGDVSGHDIRAAAAMGKLRTATRALAPRASGPAELVTELRAAWDRLDVDRTATVLVAAADPVTSEIRASSAGHPPPLLVSPAGVSFAEVRPSTPLGAPATPSRESRLDLPGGAVMLLYTDGLIEFRRGSLDDGLEGLRGRLERSGKSVDLVCEAAFSALPSQRSDDVALVALARSC